MANPNFDLINSVRLKNDKVVINNSKEFVIKKKSVLREETVLPVLENETAVIHLLDNMQQLDDTEVTGISYLSEGDYMIAYEGHDAAQQEVIYMTEDDLSRTMGSPEVETYEHKVFESSTEENNKEETTPEELPLSGTAESTPKKPNTGKKIFKSSGKRYCCGSEEDDSPSDTEWEHIPTFYPTMDHLLKDLMQRKLIDRELKELILKGLSEMKINLMDVLLDKSREKHPFELLTFAFLLFVKKRRAYVYLQKVFQSQWPTKIDLRNWKKLVNNHTLRMKRFSRRGPR